MRPKGMQQRGIKLMMTIKVVALSVIILCLTQAFEPRSRQGSAVLCLAIDKRPVAEQLQSVSHISGNDLELASSRLGAPKKPLAFNDTRRPIWNLAHMVNSIKELDYRLGKGANAIEVDVTFARFGNPLFTYHGPPCDCWRHCHQQENFDEYLRYVREVAIDDPNGIGRNMTLLFLDLKLDYLDSESKARAGPELARSLIENLFTEFGDSTTTNEQPSIQQAESSSLARERENGTSAHKQSPDTQAGPLRLVLSVNHVTDVELVNNFVHYLELINASRLLDRVAFDVGMNDDLQQIESMWRRFGKRLNLWQGDGYTNCISPFYNLERLSKALLKRDAEQGYPSKVYQWTIDLHDRMREALRLGVDAVMTNHPERLVSVLGEPEMVHNFRLATRHDDPFRKIVNRAGLRAGESARYQRSAEPVHGGFMGGLIDIVQSWLAYIKEIPFLSLPTTSRFLGSPRAQSRRATQTQSRQTSIGGRQPPSGTSGALEAANNDQLTSRNDRPASDGGRVSLSETLDETLVGQSQAPPPYEGPKWYTSLMSGLLVSVLKLMLPIQ